MIDILVRYIFDSELFSTIISLQDVICNGFCSGVGSGLHNWHYKANARIRYYPGYPSNILAILIQIKAGETSAQVQGKTGLRAEG
jgi:hypothetical protein